MCLKNSWWTQGCSYKNLSGTVRLLLVVVGEKGLIVYEVIMRCSFAYINHQLHSKINQLHGSKSGKVKTVPLTSYTPGTLNKYKRVKEEYAYYQCQEVLSMTLNIPCTLQQPTIDDIHSHYWALGLICPEYSAIATRMQLMKCLCISRLSLLHLIIHFVLQQQGCCLQDYRSTRVY